MTPRAHQLAGFFVAALMSLLLCGTVNADPSPIGTGLLSNITLGALQNSSVINRAWPAVVNYDLNLNSWRYDVFVPPSYDGTKPYGVVVYITSDATTGIVLQTASSDRNVIWIAPRNVGNNANSTDRYGAALLAIYRAKELFNIDSRRVYTSGKSGGARTASALAFYHSEVVHGTAPSSGFALPRLNEVTPDYIPNTSGQSDSYFDYSDQPFLYYYYFNNALHNSIDATAKTNKLRSYIISRYDDYREDYFVEGFHCAYEPQGQTCFLYDGPGTHQDATDAEMEEAIDYLDRTDTFPVNANITAGAGGFAGMTNISQSGASAVEATASGKTTYTLTPTLTAVAAAKTGSTFYWDNANGSTVRWLWEVKNAAPTNQRTCFGLWFAGETWAGGAPVSVTAGSNPGILITITQNGSQNRMIVSARPDSGGETVFYDGYFSFVPAYSTAWTSTQTGYLTGTGSPVEIRMDLNKSRWQLTFNGIKLDGATNSIASGTQISRDNKRMLFGYWETAVGGAMFWKHDLYTARSNTWSPITKSIFTAATGALSGAGATPSPMELRYVIASDPNLPDPPLVGPSGLAGSFSSGAVNLIWDAFAGATSYTIQRSSVSGGPYTTLQSGIAGTSYSDSTATAGNIYYYTVFATTASGSTALAPELAVGAGFQVDTWVGGGADGNWQTAANWNTVPAAGHTLTFATTTRLSNTSNFPANTSFADLMFNAGAGAFTLGGNAITLTGNVTDNVTYPQTVTLPVVLSSGAHNLTANTGNLSMSGVISGSGSVTKTGSGTATLAVANTYGGGTTVTAGTLAFGNATALSTGAVTLNGGTLKAGGGFTLANNITVSGASGFDMAGYNTTLSGSLSGSATLTLNNSGVPSTMTFGNNSGYSGTLTVNNGSAVSFNSPSAGSASAAWVFNDANAGRVRVNVGNNTLSFGSLAGSGQFVNNTSSTTSVLSVGALNTNTTFAGTINNNGTGIFALLKTGAGTLTLTGASTYSGGTSVNAGELKVLMPTTTGTFTMLGTGAITTNGGLLHFVPTGGTTSTETFANNFVFNGGTVTSEDGNTLFGISTNTITVSGSTTLQRMWGHVTTKNLQLNGILQGSSPLTLQGTGGAISEGASVWINNASNTYSGTVTVNANTGTGGFAMVVGANAALQNANVNLSGTRTAGATDAALVYGVQFASGVTAPVLGSLVGNGNINLVDLGSNNVALNTGTNGASTTFSGILSGAGSLIKSGIGTMTLSGNNSYTGATTINGGTLNVTGSISSGSGSLLVNNGGTLAGTGSVAKATTVSNGGAIAPGNNGAGAASPLILSGGLTLNNGAVLNIDLAGTAASDKIAMSGSFSASGTTTINLNALGGFGGSGTYPLITGASGITTARFSVGAVPSGYVGVLGVSGSTLSVMVMTPVENWRYTNFGTTANSGNAADNADPDGDGMTNAQEYAAGTDPNSSASVLKINQLQISGGDFVLSFPTVVGKTYRVERSDTLATGSWTTLQDNIAGTTDNGGIVQITDTGGAAQSRRFYRIILP
jgi:autotransporter-associated beta strand protein